MRKALFLLVLATIFSSAALGDIRLPDRQPTPTPKQGKSVDTTLMIRIDKNANEAKLIIPKSQLKQLRAEIEQLDDEQNTNAAVTTGFTRTQTIISGMFMSMAFLFGGIWLARSRKISTKAGKATIAGAVLFLCVSVATMAFANAGPPPDARSITGKLFSPSVHLYKFASGRIKLETSTDADERNVQLIVPDVKDSNKPGDE